MAGVDVRQDQLAGFEDAPRLFGPDEVDLLDKIAAQATDADYAATEHLLREARKGSRDSAIQLENEHR